MKSPHNQRPDDEARERDREVHRQVRRQDRQARKPRRPQGPGPREGGGQVVARRRRVRASCPELMPHAIAQVTPYPWEDGHEVNRYVARSRDELAARGHAVADRRAVARRPSACATGAARDPRRRRRAAGRARCEVAGRRRGAAGSRCRRARARRAADRRRPHGRGAVRRATPLDICHVHEPFAPSVAERRAAPLARAERRHASTRPTERVRRDAGRAQARPARLRAARRAARELRRDGASCSCALLPGRLRGRRARAPTSTARASRADGGRVRIAFVDDEERAALRLFLRALRRLDADAAVGGDRRQRARAVVLDAAARRAARARALRRRRRAEALAAPTCSSPPPTARAPAPATAAARARRRRRAARAALAVYEEVLADGERGLLFRARRRRRRSARSCGA